MFIAMKNYLGLGSRMLRYNICRSLEIPPPKPVSITLSVTNQCYSKCKTCNVWKRHKQNPRLAKEELTTWEWEETFRNIGTSPLWFSITGGEPILRDDLAVTISNIVSYNKPRYLNLATSGIHPKKTADSVRAILELLPRKRTLLTVNLSIDEIGKRYDDLRGVPNGFKKVRETFFLLKDLKEEFDNLVLGTNIVLSRYNHQRFVSIYRYLTEKLGPDSIVSEIGCKRAALDFEEDISIPPASCQKLLDFLLRSKNQKTKEARLITLLRNSHYRLMKEQLRLNKEILKCYAGYASVEISPIGEVWNCCIRCDSMGNLREHDYDLSKILRSERAANVRKRVKKERCFCTGANPSYTNILCNMNRIIKILHP